MACGPVREAWLTDLLRAHLARYPLAKAVDLYKLLHQAAMGPGHALGDPVAALAALRTEAEAVQAGAADTVLEAVVGAADGEAAVDPIGPRPGLARCHLRPWLASGGSLDDLHRAFVATAAAWRPDPERLARDLDAARCALARAGRPGLAAALAELADRKAGLGYPPVHHSAAYRDAYRPAYRVVEAARLAGQDRVPGPGEAAGS